MEIFVFFSGVSFSMDSQSLLGGKRTKDKQPTQKIHLIDESYR